MKLLNLIIVLIFNLLLFSEAQKTQQHTKADLLKRYPQLVGNTCSQKMNEMLTNVYLPKYQAMWQASVKSVTDAGLMGPCNNITDESGQRVAHYSNLQLNITHIRGMARMGFCVPIECKNQNLDSFVNSLFGFVNKQLLVLPSYGINIDILLFNNQTQLGSRFTVPEEYNKIQSDQTVTGRRVMVTLICMVILASVSSNITWAIQHMIEAGKEDDKKILPFEISHNFISSRQEKTQHFSETAAHEDVESGESGEIKRVSQTVETPRVSGESIRKSEFQSHFNVNLTELSRRTSALPSMDNYESVSKQPTKVGTMKQIFSYIHIVEDMYIRPREKNLMPLSFIKFMLQFSILITITAFYLNIITAMNPWSLKVMFSSPVLMFVVAGGTVVDTFFTIAAMLAFFNINRYLEEKQRDTLSIKEVFQLYLKRFIRFLPVVYLAFFFGVYVMPYFGGSEDPLWHTFQQILFYRCTEPDIMASKLFLVGNLYPFFQNDDNGCMPWTWSIECDMQLFLLTPWLVMLYRKIGSNKMYLLMGTCFFIGLVANYFMAIQHKLTAGVFSMNNFFQYSYYNKPWNKISVYTLGIMSAMLYIDIQKKDECKNSFVEFIVRKKTQQNGGILKTYFPWVMFFSAIIIYYLACFISFPVELTPFAWTDSQNAIWYSLTRAGWAVATMILYFLAITGHNSTALYAITSSNICIFSALIWPAYILSPMIYMNMYSRVKEVIYMTMLSNCVLGMGGIMCTILCTLAFIFLLQQPIETMVTKTFRNKLLGEVFKEKLIR